MLWKDKVIKNNKCWGLWFYKYLKDYFNMVCIVKAMVFPVVMYRFESRTIKKAERRRIDAFELWCWRRLLRQQGDQISQSQRKSTLIIHWRIDTEAPILWPPGAKSQLIRKDPEAGKDWRQEEKGTTEDKMVGWHYCLNGHEFEQGQGVSEGQGSLECCSPWSSKELDMT